MIYIIIKILLTAALIVIISEIAKFNDRLGGLISALPITTLFVITWLYFENVSYQKISNHMTYTLLYVLPTLPMFLCFPYARRCSQENSCFYVCHMIIDVAKKTHDFMLDI